MRKQIIVDKKSEFFITIITTEGSHSFIMLGVMVDNKPELLASVGKYNTIHQSVGRSCGKKMTVYYKIITSYTDASLNDESLNNDGISNDKNDNLKTNISYQSYSITYAQYLEFLTIIKEIHQDQLKHYQDREDPPGIRLSAAKRAVRQLRKGIGCYIPIHEESEKITFESKNITNFDNNQWAKGNDPIPKAIISRAEKLTASNTCRTTARDLLNYTLHYSPYVPAFFAIGLDYKTTLVGCKPTENTLYHLPQPPDCFKVNPTQMKVLEELYKKLKDLPKNKPESETTRKKFDALKEIYQKMAGEPTVTLTELLDKITAHRFRHNQLFNVRRSNGFFSKCAEWLKIKTGTQQTYDRIEKTIKQEIDRVNDGKGKKAEPDNFKSGHNAQPSYAAQ